MIHEPCLILKPEMVKIAESARIDSFCKIEGGNGIYIGEHCHIGSFTHLNAGGGELILNDHSGCSSHVVICSGMPDLSYLYISAADLPANQHPLRLKTVIGRHVVIFAGAVVLPGIHIGDGAVIAAGAVVTKNVPPMEVWAGVPARRMRVRSVDELKEFALEPVWLSPFGCAQGRHGG